MIILFLFIGKPAPPAAPTRMLPAQPASPVLHHTSPTPQRQGKSNSLPSDVVITPENVVEEANKSPRGLPSPRSHTVAPSTTSSQRPNSPPQPKPPVPQNKPQIQPATTQPPLKAWTKNAPVKADSNGKIVRDWKKPIEPGRGVSRSVPEPLLKASGSRVTQDRIQKETENLRLKSASDVVRDLIVFKFLYN